MRNTFRLLHRLVDGSTSRLRNLTYQMLGVQMDGYIWMRAVEIPRNWGDIQLGANCSLDRGGANASDFAGRA